MSDTETAKEEEDRLKETKRRFWRGVRFRIYGWMAFLIVLGAIAWTWWYLRPERWYTYTDQVAFERVALDVRPGFVLWDEAEIAGGNLNGDQSILQPAISSDGARMVYATGRPDGNSDIFLRHWNGGNWGEPRPMRALNSNFNEISPSLSGDGEFLFFSTDRPGGLGGFDIWVARWDGVEYAWPLPLTGRVNTEFDEIDPALTPEGLVLYFSSDRNGSNFDLFAADLAGDTPFDLIVERQLSMLYSLREGALSDLEVMKKLGGTAESETAVDRGLAFLAASQEPDGRWDIAKHGGQPGHDVASTAFALLAFYGRGQVHDRECKYRETVSKGLTWLMDQQNAASGDTRGAKPQGNAMYDHGIASLALVEAYGVTKDSDVRPRAQAAIDFIAESQHEEGGWRYRPGEKGDLSVTGWMVMALASAQMSGIRVEQETMDGAVKFLDSVRGGKNGGSYGYTSPGSGSNAMNAVGFFCAQLTGSSWNSPEAYESSEIVGKSGFHLNDLYYAYYGTLATYQHQGSVWREWLEKMQPAFINAQEEDGSWPVGSGKHDKALGRVITTALVTLCLQAHYRYTPLYGLGFEPDPAGPSLEAVNQHRLRETPSFRHAKLLPELSSSSDDTGPVVTEHGDFLYFASAREGGFGGSDIYRSRISGLSPSEPENLGPEINSPDNENDPAIRMAGFHLLFGSDREGDSRIYNSKSRRVVRRFDYGKLPTSEWASRNAGLLFCFCLALVMLISMIILMMKPVSAGPERSGKEVKA